MNGMAKARRAALPRSGPSKKEAMKMEHIGSGRPTRFQPRPVANALTHDPCSSHRPVAPRVQGKVSKFMDKGINKMAYNVRGSVPSSNFLTPNEGVPDLCLTGNYIYTVMKHPRSKPFTMHLDFQTNHGHHFR